MLLISMGLGRRSDGLFIAQWTGGVTGCVWLTAFTVWASGTRSDGGERETVREREREWWCVG